MQLKQVLIAQLTIKLKIWQSDGILLNNVNALNDFQNLLASTITRFHYVDCPSECRKKIFIKIIQEAIDKKL